MKTLKLALSGLGKIARDQHLPCIAKRDDISLVATISRNSELEGVPAFRDIDAAVASGIAVDAVVLCTPPQVRFAQARAALAEGWHVFLEKPPCAGLAEAAALDAMAQEKGLTLYASWHSRAAAAVAPARAWLNGKTLRQVKVEWREDVRKWHPYQDWLFEPGGMGVFDPGINALSILTTLMPEAVHLASATLHVPSNCQAPVAASLRLTAEGGTPIRANFDFLEQGKEVWEIEIVTEQGNVLLSEGGANLSIDGAKQDLPEVVEYAALYERFVTLVAKGQRDMDVAPLALTADAFLLGRRETAPAFNWDD